MRLSLRVKLLATAVSAAVAFLIVIVTSAVVTSRVTDHLTEIQTRQIPRLELGPQLGADFDALRRGFQDAVAARDAEALDRTREVRARLVGRIDRGWNLLGPTEAAALRAAVVDYDDAAVDVSRRMIARETGEDIIAAIAAMQQKQQNAQQLLERALAPDTRGLAEAFAAATRAQSTGGTLRVVTMFLGLGIVLALSLAISRGIVRSVDVLQRGLDRYGSGSFDEPIPTSANDEFSDVANAANRMAERLARLADERERAQWVGVGLVELGTALSGDADEALVARRASGHLARYLGAAGAALYRLERDGSLRLLGQHAAPDDPNGAAAKSFRLGEGLVGQAATTSEIAVIDDVPADFHRIRSGLGEASPRSVVLAPLVRDGAVLGVLELAFFKAWSASANELLLRARENIAIALDVARSRSEMKDLLHRTQEQANRLGEQETELRATNEELQAQQEELRQTNDELEVKRAALEERNGALQAARTRLEKQTRELTLVSAFKSQFLANMSHELRTPLNSMLLLSNLLAENVEANLTDKQVEYAKTVHSAGRDLLTLINQVLDLAKIEAGKQEVRVASVAIGDVVDRARRVFTPLAKERGLRLLIEVAEDAPASLETDGQLVTQILNNLLGNAIKFTEEGEVSLRIGAPEGDGRERAGLSLRDAIAFTVSDTGPGIAPEDLARIFEPFEQADAGVGRRHGGTGLGLNIARELAGLLGGDLSVRSTVGEGSRFVLYLPRHATQEKVAARASSRPPPRADRSSAPPRGGQGELLIIEDDRAFADVVGQVVRERGLRPIQAVDGASGIRLARDRLPEGIILDLKLPDIDGWQVMEHLQSDPATAGIPVHFVSALDMSDRAMALGATGYLTKPASRQDLARVVEGLGSHAGRAARRLLVVEDDAAKDDGALQQLRAEGFDARRAESAAEALALLAEERFACIILDLALPDMRGLELLEELEARGEGEMPAVVVYTDRALTKVETTKLEAYADAVILKDGPSSERLLQEIRLFVRRFEEGQRPRRGAAPRLAADVRLEGKKLLVVDDDMRTVYALSAALRSRGAEVLVAENGAVALDVLAANPNVAAVLMDVMMPEMDGYEAMRRIRLQPTFVKLPIVALTAKAMKGDEVRCIEAGASDYLPKPVDSDRLLALLHQRLSE